MLYPIKIEFKDYPSGSWQDWSTYLLEPPVISKKVESENDGEAGAIVFDVANVKLKYASGSPVYTAFSADLSVKQRYVFRISAPKSDKTYVQLFEGMADFSTLRWPEYKKAVSFDIVDKLSALNILQNRPVRTLYTIKDSSASHLPWITPLNYAAGEYYTISIGVNPTVIIEVIKHLAPSFTPVHVNVGSSVPVISAGKILKQIRSDGDRYLFARSQFYAEGNYPGENDTWIESSADSDDISGTYRIDSSDSEAYLLSNPTIKLKYYKDEFYSGNICNTIYYNDPDDGQWKTEVTSFKGEAMLRLLVLEAWPDISVTFRGFTTFNLPFSYWRQTMDENPFNKTPLEALILLANTMKCYVFINKSGNCIVQSKAHLTTSGTTRTIGSTKIIMGPEERYFWDKLVDGVKVSVLSWVYDEELGTNLVGSSEMTKQPSGFTATQRIKPKNQITKDILAGSEDIDTQAELDAHAAQEALTILNFYGLRHGAFDLVLNLDDNTIEWELIDTLILNSMQTFFTQLEFDCAERTVTLEPVEIAGHDYDLRSIVVGSPEDSASSIASGSTSGTSGGSSGVSYAFNIPLVVSGGIVSLAYTNNLKITSNQLDTAQGIKTTDIPTFAQINLSGDPENAGNAVRAGRTISTNYPLTGGSNLLSNITLSLGYNSTNLRLSSNLLNTVQDIATTSSPTFNQLTLSSAGTGVSNAVRADRTVQISTTAPLTGGGAAADLTANRSWTLALTRSNLLGTTNQVTVLNGTGVVVGSNNVTLSLPQDIHTGASPTFVNLNLTGVVLSTGTGNNTFAGNMVFSGNKSLYNNFTSGWTGSGWRLDYGVTSNLESTLEIDNLWVRGTMNVYELVINQIRATNGSLFVTSSAKVKTHIPGDPESIIVEDPYGHNIAPFAAGDILLIQRVRLDSTTIVKRIVKEVTSVSNTTVYIQNLADGPTATGIIEPGDVVVRIGNTDSTNYSNRQGAVYLTSDDSNAPYIDITNDVNNWAAWTSPTKIKARLGKLTGMSSTPFGELNGYGLYTQNAYIAGNANIWGTISAGDAYGFDPVFYAGRIQKNYAKISEGVDAGTTGYPLWAWTGNSNFVVGTTSTQTPGGSTGLVSTIRKSNSSGNVYAIIHGDTTRSWVAAGAYENKTWVISFWVRVSNAALAGNHTFYKYFYPTNQTDLGTQVVNITTEWKRVSLVFNCPNDPTSENYPRAVLELTYSATYNYQFHGLQIEEGSLSTIYQKTDGSTPVLTTGYGMWAIKGGFGGTIQNPNIALSDYGIVVRKNATASAVWVGNDTISIGFNGSTWGIIGKSGSSNIFELGSTNKIAGWTFDTEKFYNGNVRLSINSSDKGLVISQSSVDYVKVGDFTYNTSAFSYGPNNTTIDHIGYQSLDSSDFDSSSPYTDSTKWYQNAASNYVNGEVTTYNPYWMFTQVDQVNTIIIGDLRDIETWSLWISHRLDNIKLVMGKTLKFEYLLKFQDYFQNYSEHGGSYSVFLNYYNSSNSLIYQQRLEDNISVPDDPVNYGANNIFDRTGSNGITATFPVISGTSYIELNFVFNGGSQLGEYSPFSMMLSNFAINGYNKYFTYITPTGLEVYNAPDNYLRFSSLGVEIQAADLRVAGKPLVRFHGRLAAAPTASVSLGDVYIKTSDNSVNICYEINNQGIPQWKTI